MGANEVAAVFEELFESVQERSHGIAIVLHLYSNRIVNVLHLYRIVSAAQARAESAGRCSRDSNGVGRQRW